MTDVNTDDGVDVVKVKETKETKDNTVFCHWCWNENTAITRSPNLCGNCCNYLRPFGRPDGCCSLCTNSAGVFIHQGNGTHFSAFCCECANGLEYCDGKQKCKVIGCTSVNYINGLCKTCVEYKGFGSNPPRKTCWGGCGEVLLHKAQMRCEKKICRDSHTWSSCSSSGPPPKQNRIRCAECTSEQMRALDEYKPSVRLLLSEMKYEKIHGTTTVTCDRKCMNPSRPVRGDPRKCGGGCGGFATGGGFGDKKKRHEFVSMLKRHLLESIFATYGKTCECTRVSIDNLNMDTMFLPGELGFNVDRLLDCIDASV